MTHSSKLDWLIADLRLWGCRYSQVPLWDPDSVCQLSHRDERGQDGGGQLSRVVADEEGDHDVAGEEVSGLGGHGHGLLHIRIPC